MWGGINYRGVKAFGLAGVVLAVLIGAAFLVIATLGATKLEDKVPTHHKAATNVVTQVP